jgi:hypothetical protein
MQKTESGVRAGLQGVGGFACPSTMSENALFFLLNSRQWFFFIYIYNFISNNEPPLSIYPPSCSFSSFPHNIF